MSLSVGTALQDGWATFRRTPWTFVFFALFAFVLSTLADLWATVGLIRGAWLGLNGSSPHFTDLIDVNGAAVWRLFSRQVVLTVLVGVISTTALILAVTAADAGELSLSIFNQAQGIDPANTEAFNALIPELQNLAWALASSPIAVLLMLLGVITCGFGTDDAAGFLKGG